MIVHFSPVIIYSPLAEHVREIRRLRTWSVDNTNGNCKQNSSKFQLIVYCHQKRSNIVEATLLDVP